MEEVLPAQPKVKPGRDGQRSNLYSQPGRPRGGQNLPLDLDNVGVKVDPSGNIIPLLNKETPGAVQPLYSQTTIRREVPYPYYVGPGAGVIWGQPTMPYYPMPYVPVSQGFGIGIPLGRNAQLNLGWRQNGWSQGAPYWTGGYNPGYGGSGAPPYNGWGQPTGAWGQPIGGSGQPTGAWGQPYNGWAQPWNLPPTPAWRYLSPHGASPWYTPYGAMPYSGSLVGNPYGRFSGLGLGSRGGYLWLPNVTEYQSTSTVRPLFNGLTGR